MTAQSKTLWLLLLGAVMILFLLVPFRLVPVVRESIDALSLNARAQLIQRYEKPAQDLRVRADSLRKAIILRQGGIRPGQDSVLLEIADRSAEILQIVAHLRDPRKATFEERRQDISQLLEDLFSEADLIARQAKQDYLR